MDVTGECRELPAPVRRYLERVLGSEVWPIERVHMTQSGELRSDLQSEKWLRFRAAHQVSPPARSFLWDARIRVAPLIHLRVRDAYAEGVGSGKLQLLSLLTLDADRNTPELNTSALHRYLAEAVWYPTALLPSAGVRWCPIDDRTALASLTDGGNSVSLEFRFNGADEVLGIYTPARWRRVGRAYVPTPWEGRFSHYRPQQGVWVPARGEVGWHVDGQLQIVWHGQVASLDLAYGTSPQ